MLYKVKEHNVRAWQFKENEIVWLDGHIYGEWIVNGEHWKVNAESGTPTIDFGTEDGMAKLYPNDWLVYKNNTYLRVKANVFDAVYEPLPPFSERVMGITDKKTATANVPDIQRWGNPDAWERLCKASSQSQEWMRSTKAMELPIGCLVQVSTVNKGNVSEAVVLVPGLRIHREYDKDGNVVSRTLYPQYSKVDPDFMTESERIVMENLKRSNESVIENLKTE